MALSGGSDAFEIPSRYGNSTSLAQPPCTIPQSLSTCSIRPPLPIVVLLLLLLPLPFLLLDPVLLLPLLLLPLPFVVVDRVRPTGCRCSWNRVRGVDGGCEGCLRLECCTNCAAAGYVEDKALVLYQSADADRTHQNDTRHDEAHDAHSHEDDRLGCTLELELAFVVDWYSRDGGGEKEEGEHGACVCHGVCAVGG